MHYEGTELEVFSRATNWKAYWSSKIRHLLMGEVLEVGAGIGSNTLLLQDPRRGHWVCLEPDASLVQDLRTRLMSRADAAEAEIIVGDLTAIAPDRSFDAILYIDVIEHIEGDRRELERAAARLSPGGALIILAPAHGWLFSPFDKAIGHHRRYDRRSLSAVIPADLHCLRLDYLDSAGLLASSANRFFLRSDFPTPGQIDVWDKRLIPISRVLDPLLGHRVGKSVLGIWVKPDGLNSRSSESRDLQGRG